MLMRHRDVFQRSVAHEIDSLYVLECLPPGDLRTGQSLFDSVINPIAIKQGLHARLCVANSKDQFLAYLRGIREEVRMNGLSPILHFDAHGSPQGLGLGDGSQIGWSELANEFAELNTISEFNLLVVMAACSGIYLQNAVEPHRPAPLWGLIGPAVPVSAGEIEIRFGLFYSEYMRTMNPHPALEALNGAKLGDQWTYGFRSATNLFREAWRQYILGFLDPVTAEARVAEFMPLAKALAGSQTPDQVREMLLKHGFFLDRFACRFFMYDQFPRNRDRFPFDAELLITEVREAWSI